MNGRILIAIASVALSCAAVAQPMQKEPVACGPLFSKVLSYAQGNSALPVHLIWTTNYFANGVRYAGSTEIWLSAQGNDLYGVGQRQRTLYEGTGSATERVAVRIRGDQITFNDQYGPYSATCSGDRFAVIYSGDSVETFHFAKQHPAGKPPIEKPRPRPIPPDPWR